MSEVPVITDVTSPAEAYVRRLLASGQPATAEGVAAIAAVADAVSRTLAALESDRPTIPLFLGLAERMEALRDSLPPVRPVMPADEDAALEADSPVAAGIPELTGLDLSAHMDAPVAPDDTVAVVEDEAGLIEAGLLEAERLEAERL